MSITLKADSLPRYLRPQAPYSCWRCGGMIPANIVHPYYVCAPCINVVTPEEIEWVNDPENQPGLYTWEMVPLGRACGED